MSTKRSGDIGKLHDEGMAIRRAVLGEAHVDRAEAKKTGFTEGFQDFITRSAWGEIWGDETLDRRTRSLLTLAMLASLGHWEELAMHVRAALRNGVSADELRALFMQVAIYAGVPAANHAFAIAQPILQEEGKV